MYAENLARSTTLCKFCSLSLTWSSCVCHLIWPGLDLLQAKGEGVGPQSLVNPSPLRYNLHGLKGALPSALDWEVERRAELESQRKSSYSYCQEYLSTHVSESKMVRWAVYTVCVTSYLLWLVLFCRMPDRKATSRFTALWKHTLFKHKYCSRPFLIQAVQCAASCISTVCTMPRDKHFFPCAERKWL